MSQHGTFPLNGLKVSSCQAFSRVPSHSSIAAKTGLTHRDLQDGESIRGVYRRPLDLASGRFAMLDDGVGFSLSSPGGR